MPLGLGPAVPEFQRRIENALGELLHVCAEVYLDDIVVYTFSSDYRDHLHAVEKVFEKLRAVKLKVKRSKLQLCKTSVQLLGFQVSREKISFDKKRLEALTYIS
jgi:hypothetical protein